MQKRRETRKSKARTSVIYLKCLISRFFFFSFIFVFLSLIRCLVFFFLFFRFCLRARSHRFEKVVGVVSCSACFLFSMFAARRILRQTVTACDRIKYSIEEYEDVFDENIRFSVYIEILESRGISRPIFGTPQLQALAVIKDLQHLVNRF